MFWSVKVNKIALVVIFWQQNRVFTMQLRC